ncbi:MAG: ester cyclase [Gammaproteobacteria bacterium]|nr:ester cyclase [Gammaproteobacteria bacterium]
MGAYGPDSDIVDFILGITFEIWEQRGVDLIHRYYAPDVEVYGMEGVIHGAQAMVDGTRQMLEAFPDRLLLGDNVVWSGSRESGFYSSHRITSPMTNLGPSAFGEATGRRVSITNVADCVVENGVVTREWLMRDNLALVRQLGFDATEAARALAARVGPEDRDWMAREMERVAEAELLSVTQETDAADTDGTRLATEFLATQWASADDPTRWDRYAPYAVLHRSPVERYSGREAINGHYADLGRAFGKPRVSLDHVACQPFGGGGLDIAARWTAAGSHADTFAGTDATGKPVFILGVSHWRTAAGRVVAEWTVFDQLAVLGQIVE